MVRIAELGKDCDAVAIPKGNAFILWISSPNQVKAIKALLGAKPASVQHRLGTACRTKHIKH